MMFRKMWESLKEWGLWLFLGAILVVGFLLRRKSGPLPRPDETPQKKIEEVAEKAGVEAEQRQKTQIAAIETHYVAEEKKLDSQLVSVTSDIKNDAKDTNMYLNDVSKLMRQ